MMKNPFGASVSLKRGPIIQSLTHPFNCCNLTFWRAYKSGIYLLQKQMFVNKDDSKGFHVPLVCLLPIFGIRFSVWPPSTLGWICLCAIQTIFSILLISSLYHVCGAFYGERPPVVRILGIVSPTPFFQPPMYSRPLVYFALSCDWDMPLCINYFP